LFSGRLAIGADEYRRLTRRHRLPALRSDADETLVIDVAGVRGSGKTRLIAAAREVFQCDDRPIRARLEGMGLDPSLVDRLKNVKYVEVPGYAPTGGRPGESRSDRQARETAVSTSVDGDMLVLVIDGRQ